MKEPLKTIARITVRVKTVALKRAVCAEERQNNIQVSVKAPFLTMYPAGVSVGDPVLRTGKPLSVELGPGNK